MNDQSTNNDPLNLGSGQILPVEPIGNDIVELTPNTEQASPDPQTSNINQDPQLPEDTSSSPIEKLKLFFEENKQQALIIVGGLIAFVILLLIFLIIVNIGKSKSKTTRSPTTTPNAPNVGKAPSSAQTEIVVWGLWYENEIMQTLIEEYQSENPGIRITYLKQNFEHLDEKMAYVGTYFTRLREQLLSEGVVDIVEIHHSWLPALYEYLYPAPDNIGNSLANALYSTIAQAATINGRLYTMPLFADTMVLFYNKDLIDLSSVELPYTWDEFNDRITNVKKLGIPLGTFSNVFHSPEILLLLITQGQGTIMQNGKFTLTSPETKSALRFYLDYYTNKKTWGPSYSDDLKAFAKCSIPVVFAPSWRYINFINSNPNLNVGMLPTPIIGGAPDNIPQYIGSFWGFAVSKRSSVPEQAWQFIEWLSRPENIRRIYEYQVNTMKAGQPYARQDMAQEQTDIYTKTVHSMLPKAKFWRIYDYGLWEQGVKDILTDLDKTPNNIDIKLEELQQYLNDRLASYR